MYSKGIESIVRIRVGGFVIDFIWKSTKQYSNPKSCCLNYGLFYPNSVFYGDVNISQRVNCLYVELDQSETTKQLSCDTTAIHIQ